MQAARLFALTALAVSPAAGAVPEEGSPVYSLVAGRQSRFQGRGDLHCIPRLDGGRWCPEYANAWLDHARTLAGPPIGETFAASSERGPALYRPVLVVMLHLPNGVVRIVAQAQADPEGNACLPAAEVERLGWRPDGSGIESADGALCADLADIAAQPLPPPLVVARQGAFKPLPRRSRRR